MVGHAGSPTHIVYVDMTSKVKVTDWTSENLRACQGYNLVIVIAGTPQQAMHAGGGDDRQPACGAFLLNIYTADVGVFNVHCLLIIVNFNAFP